MIPPFDVNGVLPPGVHPATLAEIDTRFGQFSEIRRAQMDSVRWMIDLARRADVQRIVLNGSFVTNIIEPNDVDRVLLVRPSPRRGRLAMRQLRQGLPFLSIALLSQSRFDELVRFFETDRQGLGYRKS